MTLIYVLWTVLMAVVAYFILSLHRLEPDEIAVKDFFGKPIRNKVYGPGGIVVAYAGVNKLYRLPTGAVQQEWPGEEDEIERVDHDNVSPGKVPPDRVTFVGYREAIWYLKDDELLEHPFSWGEYSQMISEEEKEIIVKDNILHQPQTAEMVRVTQWRLERNKLWQFIQIMGTSKRSLVEEADRRLDDITRQISNAMLSKMTLGHARSLLDPLGKKLQKETEEEIGEDVTDTSGEQEVGAGLAWGVALDDAYIKDIPLTKSINKAMADAAAAIDKRKTAVEVATGEAEAIRLKGAADGDAEKARGEGRAAAIKAVAEQLSTEPGQLAARLEVAEEAFKNSKHTIFASDLAEILSSVIKPKS